MRGTIILFEEDELVSVAIRNLLEVFGYGVITARTAAERAVALSGRVRTSQVCGIMFNIGLGSGDPRRTFERIRAAYPHTPIIVTMTSVAIDDPTEAILHESGIAVLVKPYGADDLMEAFSRAGVCRDEDADNPRHENWHG